MILNCSDLFKKVFYMYTILNFSGDETHDACVCVCVSEGILDQEPETTDSNSTEAHVPSSFITNRSAQYRSLTCTFISGVTCKFYDFIIELVLTTPIQLNFQIYYGAFSNKIVFRYFIATENQHPTPASPSVLYSLIKVII